MHAAHPSVGNYPDRRGVECLLFGHIAHCNSKHYNVRDQQATKSSSPSVWMLWPHTCMDTSSGGSALCPLNFKLHTAYYGKNVTIPKLRDEWLCVVVEQHYSRDARYEDANDDDDDDKCTYLIIQSLVYSISIHLAIPYLPATPALPYLFLLSCPSFHQSVHPPSIHQSIIQSIYPSISPSSTQTNKQGSRIQMTDTQTETDTLTSRQTEGPNR